MKTWLFALHRKPTWWSLYWSFSIWDKAYCCKPGREHLQSCGSHGYITQVSTLPRRSVNASHMITYHMLFNGSYNKKKKKRPFLVQTYRAAGSGFPSLFIQLLFNRGSFFFLQDKLFPQSFWNQSGRVFFSEGCTASVVPAETPSN